MYRITLKHDIVFQHCCRSVLVSVKAHSENMYNSYFFSFFAKDVIKVKVCNVHIKSGMLFSDSLLYLFKLYNSTWQRAHTLDHLFPQLHLLTQVYTDNWKINTHTHSHSSLSYTCTHKYTQTSEKYTHTHSHSSLSYTCTHKYTQSTEKYTHTHTWPFIPSVTLAHTSIHNTTCVCVCCSLALYSAIVHV